MSASMLEITIAGTTGVLLGLFFFGGLWWTLRRAFESPRPALWVGASMLLRMAVVVAGFIAASAGDWHKMLACLLGFWAARWLVLQLTARINARLNAVPIALPTAQS
jgi:F1F0 ATPase subunit 2